MNKKDLFDKCANTKNGVILRETVFKNKFIEAYNSVKSYSFPEEFTFIQRLYHWFNDDIELYLGICPVCGKRCGFINLKSGYYKHCSVSCADMDLDVTEKKKQTKISRYGNSNYNNRDKAGRTCYEKYGCFNPGQSEQIKEKSKNTKFERYGDPYFTNREKNSDTVYGRYGVENISQLNSVKEKKKNTAMSSHGCKCSLRYPEVIEKSKLTNIKLFGVDNYSKSKLRAEKCKQKFSEIYTEYVATGIKPKHGVSKTELEFYKYLISKFEKDDIIYDYMSDLYPFRCDFYIKSLDLYIELNSLWTHGGHPFNENDNKDSAKLNLWKSKQNKYYDIAVNVWSVSDVRKRNVAKRNNLNYIEIFESDIKKIIADFESRLSGFTVS